MEMRLHKYLAQAGVSSRRAGEKLIQDGRVKVNGHIVTKLGAKVDSATDTVAVDNKKVILERGKVYVALNKPPGYITALKDPQGRKKVTDLIKNVKERIYPVGRLDYDTEGLLLLTNDGDLTYRITHPKHEISKVYVAEVRGLPTEQELSELKKGIFLQDGITAPAEAVIIKQFKNNTLIEITIFEGRNRQVRRMMEAINHPVVHLKRIRIGCISLGNLEVGKYRFLTSNEIHDLLMLTGS